MMYLSCFECLSGRIRTVFVAVALLSGCAADGEIPRLLTIRDGPSPGPSLADQLAAKNDLQTASALYLQEARNGETSAARARAFVGLGEVLLRARRPRGAAGAFRAALREDSGNGPAEMGLGVALLSDGAPEDAVEPLERAVARGEERAYAPLGAAYHALGRAEEAEEIYRTGLDRNPEDLALRSNWALSLAILGRSDDAYRQARLAAEDPFASAIHRRNLVLTLAILGESGRARQEAQAMRLGFGETEQVIGLGTTLSNALPEERARRMIELAR